MTLVVIAPSKNNLDYWQKQLTAEAERQQVECKVEIWPKVEKANDVEMVVTWKHPQDSLYEFPNLKVISSMGAGVDHILKDKGLPQHLEVVRIVDNQLTVSMSNYLLAMVLNHHKKVFSYLDKQKAKVWGYTDTPELDIKPGILGMGELGTDIAEKLALLGFEVAGYSQSPKKVEGVKSFAGEAELDAFLTSVNVLICLLPLTPVTEGYLNLSLFERCTKGTYLINVARGSHLVEEDLLKAMDKGYISGATLDVFRQEPLPKDHPFWEHPAVFITPHIASVTNPDAAIPQIITNYKRMKNQQALVNKIDRKKGY